MSIALKDKTNKPSKDPMDKQITKESNEKETVIKYIQDITNRTKDNNLKYDLTKCVEILEGKENQEFKDLKEILEETLLEKEMLFREKCELALELDYMREEVEGSRDGKN